MEQKKKELREQRQKEMKDYLRQVASAPVAQEDIFRKSVNLQRAFLVSEMNITS